jgi:hypothetical protein
MAEAHAALRQGVDVRRLVVVAAIGAELREAEIVCEDEDDVGLGSSGMSL